MNNGQTASDLDSIHNIIGLNTPIKENTLFSFCTLAHMNMNAGNMAYAKSLLDSATVYIDENKDIKGTALYHYLNGLYIIQHNPDNSNEGYNHLYKSLYYYEQLGDNPNMIINIIQVLANEVSIREDTVSINNILAKAVALNKQTPENKTLELLINGLHCIPYKINYKNNKNENTIDSILFHKKKSIEMYESGQLNGLGMEANISLLYIHMAEYEAMKKEPDFSLINNSIIKAKEIAEKLNYPLADIRLSYAQSLINYAKGNLTQAEKLAFSTNELIDNYRKFGYQQLYVDNYELLSHIYEAKENHKTALEYEELKSKYELEIRNNEIKTIELQFLTDLKDAEVTNLKTQNSFQKKTTSFITITCILLLIVTILLLLLFSAKQKSLGHHNELEKKAKDDANLKLKLKKEQTEKALLEKYEVLSDFHLKEMELIGKSKELELLEAEKMELDRQVERYAEKIEEYEQSMHRQQQVNEKEQSMCNIIKEDIEQLINKYSYETKGYIPNLNKINDAYINCLREKYEGQISVQYIKYCICFTIGMEINEVAECFCIEPASVHGLRYRLKKKFGLGTDENLELFLKSNV
jgi:hypothetical protein